MSEDPVEYRRRPPDPTRYAPGSVDDAAKHLLTELSDEQRQRLAAMADDDLIGLHFSLGLYLRNNYDLEPLVRGYGEPEQEGVEHFFHTDSVSAAIIRRAWTSLRAG